MLIGKKVENIHKNKLSVDKWTVEHIEDKLNGDTELVETYTGKVEIGQVDEQKYLGFIISNSGNNMANIRGVRNKSIGSIRKIFTKLNGLNLQKYYFECGMIFLNVMLRSSILYACETYYNLKENEIRFLERIEESFMRQLLKTTKGCPIVQLYMELGLAPARVDILKTRLFFLKYILDQEEESMIHKFLTLQIENPTRFDWASTCVKDLNDLEIQLSFSDIKNMTENGYKEIVRKKCSEYAYKYLMNKRGTKGSEIEYKELKMSEYLLPNNQLTIEEQRTCFGMRNGMIDIPANFSTKKENKAKCICKEKEDMRHIYNCEFLNSDKPAEKYERIFSDNISEQKSVLKRFEQNMEIREQKAEEFPHAIQVCDPPFSVLYGIGNG
jgi:hypothetical protein